MRIRLLREQLVELFAAGRVVVAGVVVTGIVAVARVVAAVVVAVGLFGVVVGGVGAVVVVTAARHEERARHDHDEQQGEELAHECVSCSLGKMPRPPDRQGSRSTHSAEIRSV